jgi:hypothetical protein
MEFLFVHADPVPSIRIGMLAVHLLGYATLGLPPGLAEKGRQRALAEIRDLLGRPALVADLIAALRRHGVEVPEWGVQVLAEALDEKPVVQSVSSPPQ